MNLLVITDFSDSSFLEENGAKLGDIIFAINGVPVFDNESLASTLKKADANVARQVDISLFTAAGVRNIKFAGGKLGIVMERRSDKDIALLSEENALEECNRIISDFESKHRLGVSVTEIQSVILTTSFEIPGMSLCETKGIVTAEAVIGINILKDVLVNFRDIFGGRSATAQNVLKDLRNFALQELKKEASLLGANAVISVDLDYSELSKNDMLFLVASGTAVIVEKKI